MSASDESEIGRLPLSLTDEERELLLKACRHYRSTIPVYLRSREREIAIMDALIRRLSSPSA